MEKVITSTREVILTDAGEKGIQVAQNPEKKITTIQQIEEEQAKLKMMMEITRQEFAESLVTNQAQVKNFLIKKVVVPAGAVGLGVAALNKMSSRGKSEKVKYVKEGKVMSWKTLIPILLNVFQSLMLQKQKEDIKDIKRK